MIWLTSDFHFGHEKEFIWAPRGFGSWIEAAHKIIQNYNSVINYDDTVYILGDCMLKDNKFGLTCLRQLKGNKYLAYGNHDTDDRIEIYKDAKIFEDIQMGYRFKEQGISFWATHYPMKMGNYHERHPVWNLSGHTHKPDIINKEDCIYNVALDAHNNYPVSLEQIINDIKTTSKD